LEKLDSLNPEKFEVSNEDIINCRRKTIGIVEIEFMYNDRKYKLFDVGGQRNERKKWIHCFQEVTCLLFVASLSDYDLTCYEDDVTNRMQESLELYNEIINGTWFKSTQICLLLNKTDIFKKKLQQTDLSVAFSEYEGGQDYDTAMNFIKKKFEELNKYDPARIHYLPCCATNQKEIADLFGQVSGLVVENLNKTKKL
jgi:GTPase SAR1 family protein